MEKRKRLSINSATILDENILYFAINNGNGLFSYDLSSQELIFLGYFPGESKKQSDLYYTAVKYNNYLLFPPYHAEKFAVYDIEKQKFIEWDLLTQIKNREIVRTILYKDKMYLFGTWLDPYLMKVDFFKKSVSFDEAWMEEIYSKIKGGKYCRTENKGINSNGKDLFISVTTDGGAKLLWFDMEKEVMDWIDLPVFTSEFELLFYSSVYANECKVWAARPVTGQIVELDRKTGNYVFYDMPIGKKTGINSFSRIFQVGQCLLLVPYTANYIIKIDINTRIVEVLYYEAGNELNEYEDGWEKYSWSEYRDGILYAFRTYTCSLQMIDIVDGNIKELIFPDINSITSMYILYEDSVYEGLTINNNLEIYLEEINRDNNAAILQGKNRGKMIYDQIVCGDTNYE